MASRQYKRSNALRAADQSSPFNQDALDSADPRKMSHYETDFSDPDPGNRDIHVDMRDGGDNQNLPATFEYDEDGNFDEAKPSAVTGEVPFEGNLAEALDQSFLDSLGDELVSDIEADIEERAPWKSRFEMGMQMLGLVNSDIDDGAFPGASKAVHPLLIEAVTQFWARGMGELFPSEGPCKGKVNGDQTEDKISRASRIAEYMNFEMTQVDESYLFETSRLMWAIPFHGSAFRKTYRDPILDRNVGVYVPAEDFIVPAEATDLHTAQRFTHRMRRSKNDITRLKMVGFYREVDLGDPAAEMTDEVQDLKNQVDDVASDGDVKSARYELLEICVNLDIPGYEHMGEDGKPTGLELPYVVTVERASGIILAIYRNWEETDHLCRTKLYFQQYDYIKGMGFYGYGLLHLIGGLQEAATGALRVLLDGAASASLSGGFIAKNANLKGQTLISQPGVWQPVDATAEDLAKAFFPLPVKEPSQALFQLLGLMTEQAQKFTSTTELMTGEGDAKNAPVGTTQMMIEQGGKVMSTIHRMIHVSLTRELRLRFELCRKYMPEGGYPYDVAGQTRKVYEDDFAPGVEIVPISDPNIFSTQQRMAQAQALYQLQKENPSDLPKRPVLKRLLQAMRIPDVDELMPDDKPPPSYDPIGEIQALLMGKPITVTPDQQHAAHLQVLGAFMTNPQYGGNPQVQQQIGPALIALLGQHMAYAYVTAARMGGAQVGYMDPGSGQVQQPQGNVPPEVVANQLAALAPMLSHTPGLPNVPDPNSKGKDGGGDNANTQLMIAQAKMQAMEQQTVQKGEQHQQNMQAKQAELQFKQQAEGVKLEAIKAQADAKVQAAQAGAQAKQASAEIDGQIKQQLGQQQIAQSQQQHDNKTQLDQQRFQSETELGQRQAQNQELSQAREHRLEEQQQSHQQHLQSQQAAQPQQPAQQPEHPGQPHPAGNNLGHLRAPNRETF